MHNLIPLCSTYSVGKVAVGSLGVLGSSLDESLVV